MSNPAITADIEDRWRPLTDAEETVATTRLNDAWRELRRLVPNIETRMASDEDLTDTVVQILADAVIRVLWNAAAPQGVKRSTVSVDDASRSLEYERATVSTIEFTDAEIAKVSGSNVGRARAYSVMPS